MIDELLPRYFCWTRFGTEAGEPIEAILERKEHERRANDGVFLWGIGNSVAPGMTDLIGRQQVPRVLFSPIKSRPRQVDVNPGATVRWRAGIGLDGQPWNLPEGSRVISRAKSPAEATQRHYALVCFSPAPLRLDVLGWLRFQSLRNIRNRTPIGASQVTAVVERLPEAGERGLEYQVAMSVMLVAPYFLRLSTYEPVASGRLLDSRHRTSDRQAA